MAEPSMRTNKFHQTNVTKSKAEGISKNSLKTPKQGKLKKIDPEKNNPKKITCQMMDNSQP